MKKNSKEIAEMLGKESNLLSEKITGLVSTYLESRPFDVVASKMIFLDAACTVLISAVATLVCDENGNDKFPAKVEHVLDLVVKRCNGLVDDITSNRATKKVLHRGVVVAGDEKDDTADRH